MNDLPKQIILVDRIKGSSAAVGEVFDKKELSYRCGNYFLSFDTVDYYRKCWKPFEIKRFRPLG